MKYKIGWREAKQLFSIKPLSDKFARNQKELDDEIKYNKKLSKLHKFFFLHFVSKKKLKDELLKDELKSMSRMDAEDQKQEYL